MSSFNERMIILFNFSTRLPFYEEILQFWTSNEQDQSTVEQNDCEEQRADETSRFLCGFEWLLLKSLVCRF